MDAGRSADSTLCTSFRYHEREIRRATRALRDAGVAIVWDNDDDLSDPDQAAFAADALAARRDAAARPCRDDDLAGARRTSTASWGAAEVHVVENYLPDYYAGRAPRRDDEGRDDRLGGRRRARRRPASARAAARRSRGCSTPSARCAWRAPGCNSAFLRALHLHRGSSSIRSSARYVGGFDVGIAPIADNPFNRAKSNVKVKEYAVMGVPWLASPIGPYAGLGEKQGGRLVPDDRWYEELERLVDDERARRGSRSAASSGANGQRLRRNLGGWEAAMRRRERARDERRCLQPAPGSSSGCERTRATARSRAPRAPRRSTACAGGGPAAPCPPPAASRTRGRTCAGSGRLGARRGARRRGRAPSRARRGSPRGVGSSSRAPEHLVEDPRVAERAAREQHRLGAGALEHLVDLRGVSQAARDQHRDRQLLDELAHEVVVRLCRRGAASRRADACRARRSRPPRRAGGPARRRCAGPASGPVAASPSPAGRCPRAPRARPRPRGRGRRAAPRRRPSCRPSGPGSPC